MDPETALTFFIPGEPSPQERPRFTGKFCYKSKRSRSNELNFKIHLQKQILKGFESLSGPVHISLHFFLRQPKKKSKELLTHPAKKPDLDNLVKFVLDNIQPTILLDDKQVCSISCTKEWSPSPQETGTLLKITSLNGKNFLNE